MKASSGGAKTALQMTLERNQRPSKFTVAADENTPMSRIANELEPALLAPQCRVPQTMTSENDRENQMLPSKWNNAKVV